MLQTYTMNDSGVSISTNDTVPFNINSVSTRCKIVHYTGTPTIELNQNGYYLVEFTSFGYNTGEVVTGTPYSGTYTFQLNNKGVPIVNTIASASSTSDTDIVNVSFSTIVSVPSSCRVVNNNAELTINYLGQEGTIFGANLTVIKLD